MTRGWDIAANYNTLVDHLKKLMLVTSKFSTPISISVAELKQIFDFLIRCLKPGSKITNMEFDVPQCVDFARV